MPAKPPREGNLEAPTRHPVDWRSDSFYDRDSLHAELERVFDICHGCRRCVSLCEAFPTLFDLVDESETMEVDGVAKQDYAQVVEQCYLCDMCYMAKCPYVPPHDWNVDFPHLMLRAKAVEHREGKRRSDILTDTDKMGKLAGIPLVTETINTVNTWQPARKLIEKFVDVDAEAALPPFAKKKFRSGLAGDSNNTATVQDGQRTPGKVALFAGCYINFNEPGIGHDFIAVLEHNEVPWSVAEKEACCGMPKLEQGDLESVESLMRVNIPFLLKLAREGYAITSLVPSCTLMFKQELPLLFPENENLQEVASAFWDPFNYLVNRNKDGLLKQDFKHPLGSVAYHAPCHGRVQNIGKKTEEFLRSIPGSEVSTTERCSGHAGTYGVRRGLHEKAMKIGKPVFKKMQQADADYISSDCPLGAMHIAQGIEKYHGTHKQRAHPISLVRRAYGV
ncbi:MAG: Fe-S oxidoreductase [Gammaproteobacteria bacterium]|nr:Fe-S oxidoreductase [Gammaproteobacteria bacterium]